MLPHPKIRAWLDRQLTSLAQIKSGPTEALLADAPHIERWAPVFYRKNLPVLWSPTHTHTRPFIARHCTARLLAIDPTAGWAYTTEGWYRLGQSFSPQALELARRINDPLPDLDAVEDDITERGLRQEPAHFAWVFQDYIASLHQLDADDRAPCRRKGRLQ